MLKLQNRSYSSRHLSLPMISWALINRWAYVPRQHEKAAFQLLVLRFCNFLIELLMSHQFSKEWGPVDLLLLLPLRLLSLLLG